MRPTHALPLASTGECAYNACMVVGYNNNFKYKERIFHVQTEDNGPPSHTIVTHLFYSGTIIATKRACYADAKNCTELNSMVKDLMEAQHRKMMQELNAGRFDDKIAALLG